MSGSKLVIGTRGSALALKQADITKDALRSVDPSIEVEIRVIQTQGDTNQNPIPLDTIGKGWFTKEIEIALLGNEIDIAVHSLKDMAEEMPTGLRIGAYLSREDARDVLITKHGESLEELPSGAVIGTDSVRRQIQMKALRPDTCMQSLRGNVPTRLEKLAMESYDAIILAAAGLKRLNLEHRITRYFEVQEMTPAPGQGTLALQTRVNDVALEHILTAINNPEVAHIASIERSFSHALGGGCKSPTGAYAWREHDTLHLLGMWVGAGTTLREEVTAPWNASKELGEVLAQKFLGT